MEQHSQAREMRLGGMIISWWTEQGNVRNDVFVSNEDDSSAYFFIVVIVHGNQPERENQDAMECCFWQTMILYSRLSQFRHASFDFGHLRCDIVSNSQVQIENQYMGGRISWLKNITPAIQFVITIQFFECNRWDELQHVMNINMPFSRGYHIQAFRKTTLNQKNIGP